jgi:heme-degrading monooxygenase HmoA
LIVAHSCVHIGSEAAEAEFLTAMRTRSRKVERFPGFVRFEFRRDARSHGRYVIATWWESKADLRRYLASPEHRETHERLTAGAQGSIDPPRVEVHEVLDASGR